MSEIELFRYQDRDVRTVVIDGEPWFVAADVCEILGYSRINNALRMLDTDDLATHLVSGSDGRDRPGQVVSEAGLFDLILRSERPEAKAFKRWVTHDVLPQIRRTGTYTTIPASRPAVDLTTPEGVLVLAEQFAATARQLVATKAELQQAAPAANAWNTLVEAHGDMLVGDAAKVLSRDLGITLGERRLFARLAELRWVYRGGDRRWRAYQTAVDAGWLAEILRDYPHPYDDDKLVASVQIRVTVRGLGVLHAKLTPPPLTLLDGDAAG